MKIKTPNTHKRIFVMLLLLAPILQRLEAEPNVPANGIAATDLSSSYRTNPQDANANYTGKKISITGKVKDLEYQKGQNTDDSTVAISFVVSFGAPDIKVKPISLAKLIARSDKDAGATNDSGGGFQSKHELKYVSGHISVRSVREHEYKYKSAYGYTHQGSSKYNGEWHNLISVGDEITITGTCLGKTMDISISDASF